jgi:hypothetical protein
LACALTPVLQEKMVAVTNLVLKELDRLAVTYREKEI